MNRAKYEGFEALAFDLLILVCSVFFEQYENVQCSRL
jgi:hypothetical protein